MAVNIVVPSMSFGESLSTKDLIISNLIDEWPLTAKQLFNRLSKQGGQKVTYQAVHKMLVQLAKEEIVVKQGSGYYLSKEWIEKIKKFSDNLSAIYSSEKSIPPNYSFEKPVFLTFNNFSEVARFLIYGFHGALPNPPKEASLCLWNHAWPAIGLSDKEYTFIRDLFSCGKYYSLTKCSTPLDIVFDSMLRKIKKKTICGISFSAQQDTFVHDDIIMQVFFPPEIIEQMNKIYSTKKIDAEGLNELFSGLVSKEAKINVIIFKNSELANKLREETLQLFAKAKKK